MSAPELISRLMVARNAAHMAHLQTTSFAQHKALDDFYTAVVDLIDSFAETYQGIHGLIKNYPVCATPTGNPVVWLQALRGWMKGCRETSCTNEPELLNIHDEIMALVSQTLYKLRFLDSGEGAEDEAEEALPALPASKNETRKQTAEKPDGFMSMAKWG